jgi:hypothetical protein
MSSISDSILFVILSILASSVIIIVGLKLDIKGVDKPTRSISKRDKDVFRNIFWARVSERYLSRNTNTTEFVFDVDGVRRPIQEGGLGIQGFEQPFIEQMLREIQDQDGLID